VTDQSCSTPRCCNVLEPYATDGGDLYRTGDSGGKCAACNETAVCACCGEPYPIAGSCEDCDGEELGAIQNEPNLGTRTTVHGTVRGLVA
jgi:hypothetical protein